MTTHFVYDPSTDSYGNAAALPHPRDHMVLAAVGDKLYAIGGRFSTPAANTHFNDIYDARTDKWTAGAPLPTARSGCAFGVLNGRIDVIGGEENGGVFEENESYDPATDTWAHLAPLPHGVHGTGAAVFGNAISPRGRSCTRW